MLLHVAGQLLERAYLQRASITCHLPERAACCCELPRVVAPKRQEKGNVVAGGQEVLSASRTTTRTTGRSRSPICYRAFVRRPRSRSKARSWLIEADRVSSRNTPRLDARTMGLHGGARGHFLFRVVLSECGSAIGKRPTRNSPGQGGRCDHERQAPRSPPCVLGGHGRCHSVRPQWRQRPNSSPSGPFIFSGTIRSAGAALSGVQVFLSGGASLTTVTDSQGAFSFADVSGNAFVVTPFRWDSISSPLRILAGRGFEDQPRFHGQR